MLDLIWNLFQDSDIERLRRQVAEREAGSPHDQASALESRLAELERRHEQLKLVTLSLWRLLQDRVGLSEAELRKYVESTDLLDGSVDGMVDLSKELIECRSCHRHHLNTAIVCPYCGARPDSRNPFETA